MSGITPNTGTTAIPSTAEGVNATFTLPSGVLVGDFMLVFATALTFPTTTTSFSTPASGGGNWTQVDVPQYNGTHSSADVRLLAWWRIATASDPGSTFSVAYTGSIGGTNTTFWTFAMQSWSGVNTASPVDVGAGAHAQATSVTCPSLTTGANGDWAIYVGGGYTGDSGEDITGPSGATQRQDNLNQTTVAAIYDSNGPVGTSGTSIGGGTFTSGTTTSFGAFTIGLVPAGSAAISVVQTASTQNSQSVTLGSNVTAGNSVLLQANMYTTSGSTISSSNPLFGGSPVSGANLVSHIQSPSTDGVYIATWLLPNLSGGSGDLEITITQNIASLIALEIAGLGPSPLVTLSHAAEGDSTTPGSGSIGPVGSVPCIVVGGSVGFAATQDDPGSPWTFIPDAGNGYGALGYQIITSGGSSYSWAVTQDGLTADWAADIVAISANAGSGGASMAFLGFFP